MAKGNMFQGMARGKVGDVVFSRLNGEQISRVRNRNPRNPKSNGQLYQRAIMATVMAAYSAGKEIFDHSFQGVSVGSGNQRAFLKENAKALRAQLALEVSNQAVLEEALAKVTAPGIQVPVPNQWIISKGTYDQNLFTFIDRGEDMSSTGFNMPDALKNDDEEVIEKISDYYNRVGMVVGDIYTFVFILTNKNKTLFKALGEESVSFDELKAANFGFVRMIVKQPADPDAIVEDLKLRDVFDFQAGGNAIIGSLPTSFLNNDPVTVGKMVASTDYVQGSGYAIGVIRSRLDEDLRSSTTMTVVYPAEFGIVYSSLLTAWKQGTEGIGNSDLILEGGDE